MGLNICRRRDPRTTGDLVPAQGATEVVEVRKTRMSILACLAIAAVLALAGPAANANHGQVETISGVIDGTPVVGVGQYVTGNFDEQIWHFNIVVGAATNVIDCDGFGSVEVGFVGDCDFTIGGTGDPHPYPNGVDTHDVTFDDGNVSGDVTIVVLG